MHNSTPNASLGSIFQSLPYMFCVACWMAITTIGYDEKKTRIV